MSRVRISPTAWKDEGPSFARTTVRHFAVTADVIGAMRPVFKGSISILTPAEAARAVVLREKRKAERREARG